MIALYMEASDLAAFYSRWKPQVCRSSIRSPRRPWGQEEFTVEDHEGNWLTFWKKNGAD